MTTVSTLGQANTGRAERAGAHRDGGAAYVLLTNAAKAPVAEP